ncbi:hypothetical protein HYS00_02210 [Candidatus Microgenomates bacterium]|nr:hypothetical protein [Candidatus Microgenomates bacterium]
MKRALIIGSILLLLVSLTSIVPLSYTNAQESEQFKIEGATILQDTSDQKTAGTPIQSDQRRAARLSREGYSALIGETPLRSSFTKTNLDFNDSPNSGSSVAESTVKIIYTKTGGYAVYLGERQGLHTASVFLATGCDGDMNRCFSSYARPWLESDIYGFGYTVTGTGSSPDFVSQDYFRPFSVLTTQNPAGNLVAEGQAREAMIGLKMKLNQARPKQGSFSQPVVITVLHDW